jgi:transcriptional regulator with XRE-family HTH domain
MNELETIVNLYLKKNRLTLQQLADEIGVSRMTLWRWCTGASKPSKLALNAMAGVGLKVRRK